MYNRIMLIGRLCADPEYRQTPQGVSLARMRLAVNRGRKNQAGEDVTDFFDVTAWRQSAEFAVNFLRKGRLVMVEGRMESRAWTSQTNEKRISWDVQVDRILGLDRPREGDAPTPGAPVARPEPVGAAPQHEDTHMATEMGDFGSEYDPFANDLAPNE